MTSRTMDKVRYVGFDANGIRRVYGEHETSHDVAESRCRDEAAEYVRRRPDTGPIEAWTFAQSRNGVQS